MIGITILVVWCAAEMVLAPRLIVAYTQWREHCAPERHTSYFGVLVDWDHRPHEAFIITLATVSVAKEYVIGERIVDMALEEVEHLTVEVPCVVDIDSYCRRWAARGARVRVELVARREQILFFSILDETGVGISRLHPEFLQWGHES